jgi:hypothetical protein
VGPRDDAQRAKVAQAAEELDRLRQEAIHADRRVTLTGIYNVLDKLEAGEELTAPEATVHQAASCGVLRDLRRTIDETVAAAYGWSWPLSGDEILARLVALHVERSAEEKRGVIRWLRPAFQHPGGATPEARQEDLEITTPETAPSAARRPQWPSTAVAQLQALTGLLAAEALTQEEVVSRFEGVRAPVVQRHLDTLVLLGELSVIEGRFYAPKVTQGPETAQ